MIENNLIFKDKELKDYDTRILGVEGENKQQVLIFKVEESFLDGKAYLELILPDECTCKRKKYAIELEKDAENECYKLEVKRSLLRYEGMVRMQLKIVQNAVEVYKTKIFEMHVLEAINGVESIEEDYPDLVTELETRINDLEDGVEQLDKKVEGIKVPTKLSDLEDDSNFVKDENYVHTDNNFTTADKEKLDGLKEFDDVEIKKELEKKANLTDLEGLITNTVDDLVNYYSKTESYSKEEINNIVNNIATLNIAIVESLPTENISTSTIYLVAKENSEDKNVYDEYIYVSESWEKIGDTKISLVGLATEEYVDNKIGDIDAILSNIADESEAI